MQGAIYYHNPDNIGIFQSFCASLLEPIDRLQSLRMHSQAIAENNYNSYYEVLRLLSSALDGNLRLGSCSGFNEAMKKVGGSFIFREYCDVERACGIENLGSVSPKQITAERPPNGNRAFFLFRKYAKDISSPQARIYKLTKCYFSYDISRPGRPEFYVFDSLKKVIRQLSHGFKPFICDEIEKNEDCAFIDDMFPGSNICHLLLDKLPRTEIFKQVKQFLLFKKSLYLDSLRDFLLPEFSFNECPGVRGTLYFENFYISTVSTTSYFHVLNNNADFAAAFTDKLRQNLSHASLMSLDGETKKYSLRYQDNINALTQTKKLFISRRDASYRNATNSDNLETLMSGRGYTVLRLSNLDVALQILSFCNATHIIGIHGAGLSNILFSTNCKILEIFPANYGSTAYQRLSQYLGHHYFYYAVNDPLIKDTTYSGSRQVTSDLEIDLEDFSRYLQDIDFDAGPLC